jgi:hypothetical protein
MNNNTASTTKSWLIVAHSAIGLAHIKKNLPCQDAHYLIQISSKTGIAVVCDGAGSAEESDIGAKFVAEQTALILKREIESITWQFPSNKEEWQKVSNEVFLEVWKLLVKFAQDNNKDIKSLACTVIAVIYSPENIFISHIGDGRAAYRNKQGDWKAIMTPFKGEEANQTIFITSDLWRNNVDYIGCKVIHDDVFAFTIMSDGCENHAFQLNSKDEEKWIYLSLNEPYINFFEPLVEQLLSLDKQGYSSQQLNEEWQNFIECGNENLAKESDDKTMILGILKA